MPPKRKGKIGTQGRSQKQELPEDEYKLLAELKKEKSNSNNNVVVEKTKPATPQERLAREALLNARALIKAIIEGDDIKFNHLLNKKNINLNFQDDKGLTPLMHAARKGDTNFLSRLLNAGADPDIQDSIGLTALMYAARKGYDTSVGFLLRAGANPNLEDLTGSTAFTDASNNGHTSVMEQLVQAGVKTDTSNSEADSQAALRAYSQKSSALLQTTRKAGIKPHIKSDGEELLRFAAIDGNADLVKILLREGINPNTKDPEGTPVLIVAASNNFPAVVKALLDGGANPDIEKSDGITALMFAAYKGYVGVVKVLLEGEAKLNIQKFGGGAALFYAAKNGHVDVVDLLLNAGADPNIQNSDGVSALMIAAYKGYVDVVKVLLQAKAKLNIQKFEGGTALFYAAKNGHAEVVDLLLNAGADPNIQISNGVSALMIAAHNGHAEVVDLLLAREKINIKAKNKDGVSALEYSFVLSGDLKIAKKLILKGADLNNQDLFGSTSLSLAIECQYEEVVRYLIEQGADVTIADYAGNTAYKLALEENLPGVAELIKTKLTEKLARILATEGVKDSVAALKLLKAVEDAGLEEGAVELRAKLADEGIIKIEKAELSDSEVSDEEGSEAGEGTSADITELESLKQIITEEQEQALVKEEAQEESILVAGAESPSTRTAVIEAAVQVEATENAAPILATEEEKQEFVNDLPNIGTSGSVVDDKEAKAVETGSSAEVTPSSTPSVYASFDFKAEHQAHQERKAQERKDAKSKSEIYKYSWKIKGHSYSVKEGNVVKVGDIYLGIGWKVETQLGSVYQNFEKAFKEGMVSSEHGESGIKAFLEYPHLYELKVCNEDKRVLTSKKIYVNPLDEKLVLLEHVKNHKGVEKYLHEHGTDPMQVQEVLLTEIPKVEKLHTHGHKPMREENVEFSDTPGQEYCMSEISLLGQVDKDFQDIE